MAAISVLVTGATFAFYEGVSTVLDDGDEQTLLWGGLRGARTLRAHRGLVVAESVSQVQAERRALGVSL